MKKKSLPLSQVYKLLEPGPVVLVTTAGPKRPNVMAMSWLTMMEFEPPLVGCVLSGRNYSFHLLKKTGECVINVPAAELAAKIVKIGNASGSKTDKFKKFGLTPVEASKVGAPLIEECFASLECRVVDERFVPDYNFFVLRVVKAWISTDKKHPKTIHHNGNGYFTVDGERIKLASKKK